MMCLNSTKYSLKSRIKPLDSATRDFPPPNTYYINFKQTEQNKFNAITFGVGGRVTAAGKIEDNPGPGTYKNPSAFDKFKSVQ